MTDVDELVELHMRQERVVPPIPPIAQTRAEIDERWREIADDRERVLSLIDGMRDEIVECLRTLVQIPSVNPSPEGEKPLADYVAGQMRELGMEVEQIEPAPTRVSNLARLRGSAGDRSLLYYAHLDTVPTGDWSEWEFPPFEARVADGRIWGRGSKDCKLGLAAALMAIKAIQQAGLTLAGDVQLVTPADEERGGYWGLARMVERGMIKADWAIYGEGSTEFLTIGHRGMTDVIVTTKGKTAHTARKHLGENAIMRMCRVAPAIESMEFKNWQPHPIVAHPVVASVNMIQGGMKENVVPDRCSVTVDVRFPPGVTAESVVAEMRAVVEDLRELDPEVGEVEVRAERYARASFVQPDEPIVLYMQRAIREVLGRDLPAKGMPATSDSRWLVLDAGIPTVNFSNGNDSGHRPNEWAGIQDLLDNTRIYALMALLLLR